MAKGIAIRANGEASWKRRLGVRRLSQRFVMVTPLAGDSFGEEPGTDCLIAYAHEIATGFAQKSEMVLRGKAQLVLRRKRNSTPVLSRK